MPEIKYKISEIDAATLTTTVGLSPNQEQLIEEFTVNQLFNPTENFVEIVFYTLDNQRRGSDNFYDAYKIPQDGGTAGRQGATALQINVQEDYLRYGYTSSEVKIVYNFFNNIYTNSNESDTFYIQSISPDRTEIRLVSLNLTKQQIDSLTGEFIARLDSSAFVNTFGGYIDGQDLISAINIDSEPFKETTAVLIKLSQPLTNTLNVGDKLAVVERIADSIAFEVNTEIIPDKVKVPYLRSANFEIEVPDQVTEPSEYFNYNELFSFPTQNSNRELNSLFNEKGAELGIEYTHFKNFINLSSAEERLRNFKYKLDLIESYQSSLDTLNTVSNNNSNFSGSVEYFTTLISGIINNFDHYERHLYYTSGSSSWPKSNTSKPYINQLSTTTEATNWYNNKVQEAILYDSSNPDILVNTIPSYLREDSSNEKYELFIHMIAQHFDNLWIYTDAVSKKYNADNRLTKGVSKDLVEELLKNFGVKLYTSSRSTTDLFKYFTKNTYDTEGEQLTAITSGGTPVSQNDYQKEIYKRIYHNLPLLMKSKGTERGLRALINCFGIPSEILKIKIYGGQSANNLPFFGGEQAWTGSLDKVRLNNTGSIVQGDTISYYTSILNTVNEFTQDLHRIEVGFSPSDNIDNYIVSQSAVLFPNNQFNIDDYIGDPREISTNSYTSLSSYMQTIFQGVDAYDLKDFVRLIKFFDNVIFRMVRDFIPARVVADTGIIIKPHLLERNKHTSPTITWTQPEYSGSIDTAFITGSDGGVYTSGSSTNYTKIVVTPTGPQVRRWIAPNSTISAEKNHEEAKYDGELNNSQITVTTGELNKDNPYKNIKYLLIKYDVSFLEGIPADACIIQSTPGNYILTQTPTTVPLQTVFSGATPNYNFTVDGVPVTGFSFEFDGSQYTEFVVDATHTNPSIVNNLNPGQPCEATKVVKIVKCDLPTSQYQGPNILDSNQTYDITQWFTTGINTQVDYLINSNLVADPSNVTLSNISQQTTTISITVRDTHDTLCDKTINIPFTTCPLYDQVGVSTIGLLQLDIQGSDTFLLQPFGFVGTSPSTTFSFKLRATYAGTTYISPDWVQITTNPARLNTDIDQVLSDYPNSNPQNSLGNVIPNNIITSLNTFEIQFKAFTVVGCELISIFRQFPRTLPTTVSGQVSLGYQQAVNNICSTTSFNIQQVFVQVEQGQPTPTFFQVIQQAIPIFQSNNLTAPASPGYYFTPVLPALRQYRYWNGNNWEGVVSSTCTVTGPGGGIEIEAGIEDIG